MVASSLNLAKPNISEMTINTNVIIMKAKLSPQESELELDDFCIPSINWAGVSDPRNQTQQNEVITIEPTLKIIAEISMTQFPQLSSSE